jgi:lysophospholipase L1-like esterase
MKQLLAAVTAMAVASMPAAALAGGPPVPDAQQNVQPKAHMSGGRFAAEIAAFAHPREAPLPGAVTLFIGSSSIRLWNVAQSFPKLGAVNRGFGGATVRDVLLDYDKVIAGVRPASVIVYVGENDIAQGAPAAQVAADLLTLLERLRADMPEARIAYLSMKPTPRRWDLYPRMEEVNAALRAKAGKTFDYLDVSDPLMTDADRPDPSYFRSDGLHMNARGYSIWNTIIERWLKPAPPVEKVAAKTVAAS